MHVLGTPVSVLARRLLRVRVWAIAGVLILAVGCGSAATPTIPEDVEFGGPEFSAIVVSSDLAVGDDNRLSFGIVNRDGMPMRASQAELRTYYWPEGQDQRQHKAQTTAEFQQWTSSAGGIFASKVSFDAAGIWELEADLVADGTEITASSKFMVKENSDTPNIGDPAPASVTLTASAVTDLSHITSDPQPDPGFYQLSVHEALAEAKPFVVVFATPAFCVSATCGPQLQQLAEVKDRYAGRANFIHVEVFKDPHLIEGTRPSAEGLVPAVAEWGLPTEPWTFVVDGQGRVAAKYEHFTPAPAIEAALLETLGGA